MRRSSTTEDRVNVRSKARFLHELTLVFLCPGCSCRTSLPPPERSATRRPRLSSLLATATAMARSEWMVSPDAASHAPPAASDLVCAN